MKTMFVCFGLVSALAFASGCGSEARTESCRALLPLEAPAEIQGARLLYQRPDGIYLSTPGQKDSKRIVADGAFPCWSPDGQSFAFKREGRLMLYAFADQSEQCLAQADRIQALAFHPNGREVWYIAGRAIHAVEIASHTERAVIRNTDCRELDIAPEGQSFVSTVKRLKGYGVELFTLPEGTHAEVGAGCSAGISPDGQHIIVNKAGHDHISVYNTQNRQLWKVLNAPAGVHCDNQRWSNHPDWIVSISEGSDACVLAHRVIDGKTWRITEDADCDRPDLWYGALRGDAP